VTPKLVTGGLVWLLVVRSRRKVPCELAWFNRLAVAVFATALLGTVLNDSGVVVWTAITAEMRTRSVGPGSGPSCSPRNCHRSDLCLLEALQKVMLGSVAARRVEDKTRQPDRRKHEDWIQIFRSPAALSRPRWSAMMHVDRTGGRGSRLSHLAGGRLGRTLAGSGIER
jgi:hypothetical protein